MCRYNEDLALLACGLLPVRMLTDVRRRTSETEKQEDNGQGQGACSNEPDTVSPREPSSHSLATVRRLGLSREECSDHGHTTQVDLAASLE